MASPSSRNDEIICTTQTVHPRGDGGDSEASDDDATHTHARGAALTNRIRKSSKNFTEKIVLDWNLYGKAVCDKSELLASYVGYLARTRIPIVYRDWRKVPTEIKTSILDSVKEAFEIPSDAHKNMILMDVGDKFRGFRKTLTKLVKDGKLEPPAKYNYIEQTDWDEFRRQRCTKDFQETSAINSENAKKNKYPYRGSRKGYARLEKKLLEQRGENYTTSTIDRSELWVQARQTMSGEVDVACRPVASKIDSLTKQVADGLVTTSGSNDILSMALGDDHPGRVKGVGLGVGSKQVFGKNKRRCARPSEQVVKLSSKVNELESEVMTLKKEILELKGKYQGGENINHSINNSCSINDSPATDNQGVWQKCELYWPTPTSMVATGQVYIPKDGEVTMLHGKPLDAETCKVVVEIVEVDHEFTELPKQTDEVVVVKDAIGGYIAWPKCMVTFVSDVRESSKASKTTKDVHIHIDEDYIDRTPQGKSDSVVTRCLSMINSVDDVDVVVNMPTSIFHQEYLLHFGKREMKIWLDERELETRHIEIYIKCLFENYNPRKFAFLSPTNLAWPVGTERRVDERVEYMVNSLRNSDMTRRLWFAPYFGGLHWMLAVIDPLECVVYWLDPMHEEVRSDFRIVAKLSMEQFNETRMPPTNPKIRKRVLRWKIIKAPKLPTDDKSGYYICRYMREIIENDVHDIPQMYFKGSPKTYDKDHLHELHKEWLEFVEPLIQECIDID